MIQWVIANTNDVASSTASSCEFSVLTGSNLFPNDDNDTYSLEGSATTSTSVNSSGTTISSSSTRSGTNARGLATSYNTSGSGQTITPASFYVQTSTTQTYQSFYTSLVGASTIADPDGETYWTTSLAENDGVVFYQSNNSFLTFLQNQATSRQATRDTTTTLSQTALGRSPFATVYQAETRGAAAEVLYWISNPAISWNGYVAASDVASSGTRFEAHPTFATAQKLSVANTGTTSNTTTGSSPAVTTLVTWSASTQNTVQKTRGVIWTRLPNGTQTFQEIVRTTTSSALSSTIFSSTRWTLNNGGAFETSAPATRSGITRATYPTTVLRQFGQQTFATTIATSSSAQTTIYHTALATKSTSFTDGAILIPLADATIGQTFQAGGIDIIYNHSKVATALGGAVSRSAFSTTGVVLGSSTAGWMSIGGTKTVGLLLGLVNSSLDYATAYNGSNVGGRTLRPATNTRLTINSDSLTWSMSLTATGSQSTETTSTIVQTAGASLTTTIQTTSRPPHAGALSVGAGATYIDTPDRGVYKDRVNGGTTSLFGEATAHTEGETSPIYSWAPITFIDFPVASTNGNPIVWAVPRNSTALPPA
jgi:hypothetical protein